MTEQARGNGFKYTMCNESMQGQPFAEQCRIIAQAGYQGIEIAPFTLVKEGVSEISPSQRKEMLQIIRDNGLVCDGLHWLLTPPPAGLHFTTPEKSVREKTISYLDELIDFCGDLEGEVMIFGSPQQRSSRGIPVSEARKYFAEGLARVADHAQQRQVKILIEHLDHTQSDLINTLEEARTLMHEIGHPAIRMMFDFHNTADETEPFEVLIRRYFDAIFHVHIQEMDGQYLGTSTARQDFLPAFKALKDLGYDKWISLEVFDFKPGGKLIAEKSMEVLRTMEENL